VYFSGTCGPDVVQIGCEFPAPGEDGLIVRTFTFLILALALLAGVEVYAEDRGLQAKADELYHNGHWERAYFIYVNDLSAIGDKYSQYMAGYMCLHGKGVERDKVKASAWYRLAAERDSREFVKVRDELLESMSEEQRLASDAAFLSLRERYSDLALMLRQLEKERRAAKESPTGSRLSGDSSSVLIVNPYTGTTTRSDLKRRRDARMKTHLDYIADKLDIEPLEPDMSDAEFDGLVQQVEAHLQVINDR
jgi:hypothetical protein